MTRRDRRTDRQHQGIDRCPSCASLETVAAGLASHCDPKQRFHEGSVNQQDQIPAGISAGGFQNPDTARQKVVPFVRGCHDEHRQSGIGNSPVWTSLSWPQGALYRWAKSPNPERRTRGWTPGGSVASHSGRDTMVAAARGGIGVHKQTRVT